jgi:hypothetical protein
MHKPEITMLSVWKPKSWKENPRKNEEAAKKLAELLKIHGVRTPIVVWEKDMVVYKGNTTLRAARLAGIKEIPVILANFKDKEAAVSYALADNKSSEWAEWDEEILAKLFNSKELLGKDIGKLTGFAEKDIMALNAMESHGMDDIPDVDIQGVLAEGGNFIVIRFGTIEEFNKVAAAFSLGKGKRVVNWPAIEYKVTL